MCSEAPGLVFVIEACATQVPTPQVPELHLDNRILCWSGRVYNHRCLYCTWMFLHHRVETWACLHHRGLSNTPWRLHDRDLSCTWTCQDKMSLLVWRCLYNRGAWAAPECFYTTESCGHLEMSTPQGPELHLDVSSLLRPVLCLDVYSTGSEVRLGVSTLQGLVLHLDVSP
jgi:hypothetical protein